MTTLELLAWIIGFGNPIAATLHGPALARWLGNHGRRHLIEPAQGTAWAVLFLTQCTFLAFGVISALGGFRWAQGLMIPVAAINFVVWWKYRPSASTPLERFTAALSEAKANGVIWLQRIPKGAAEVYTDDGKMIGYATNIRITPLDSAGKPIGDSWAVTGRAQPLDMKSMATTATLTVKTDDLPEPVRSWMTEEEPHASAYEATAEAFKQVDIHTDRGGIQYTSSGSALDTPKIAPGVVLKAGDLDDNTPGLADFLRSDQSARDAENYRADLKRWRTLHENEPAREQCPNPVYSHAESPPEQCADVINHEGECSP
jgi:hypothetical protein